MDRPKAQTAIRRPLQRRKRPCRARWSQSTPAPLGAHKPHDESPTTTHPQQGQAHMHQSESAEVALCPQDTCTSPRACAHDAPCDAMGNTTACVDRTCVASGTATPSQRGAHVHPAKVARHPSPRALSQAAQHTLAAWATYRHAGVPTLAATGVAIGVAIGVGVGGGVVVVVVVVVVLVGGSPVHCGTVRRSAAIHHDIKRAHGTLGGMHEDVEVGVDPTCCVCRWEKVGVGVKCPSQVAM